MREAELHAGPAISGTLEAERAATIRAEWGGKVLEVNVDAGEQVQAGQLLGRIDATGLEDELRAARFALASAQNALKVAAIDLGRSRTLEQAGGISRRDREITELAYNGREVELAQARARVVAAEERLRRTRLYAPFDGLVSGRGVSVGDIVQPGAALFAIVDPTSLRLSASVPANAIERLSPGAPVEFTVVGYPGQVFAGSIESVNPVVDPNTSQVRLLVSIPNLAGTLLVGLFAQGRIALESTTALAVPAGAIDESSHPPTVMRLRDGHVETVPVEVGLRDSLADLVQIDGELAAGDTLVLEDARAALAEGDTVQVLGGPETAPRESTD